MAANDPEHLKARILKRFGSLHAFAKSKPGGLSRSTIYAIFSGKYGGDQKKQLEKMKMSLDGPPNDDEIFTILQTVACALCKRNPRRSVCRKCWRLWSAQAAALRGTK